MTRSLRVLITAVALVATALVFIPDAGAQSQTIYVAPNGNDANPGTVARPKATMVAAMRALPNGGEIRLRGGHYTIRNNSGLLWQGGRPGQPLVVTSAPGERARLTSAPGNHCVAAAADYIQIRRISCTGWMGIGAFNASNIVIARNKIGNLNAPATQGIIVSGTRDFRNITIIKNRVTRVPHSGIAVGDLRLDAVSNVLVEGNRVRLANYQFRNTPPSAGGWGSGISMVGANGARVIRNDVRRTFGEGFNCALSNRCLFRKNVAVDAYSGLFYGDNATNSIWEGNVAKTTGDRRFTREWGFGPTYAQAFVFANEVGWYQGPGRNTRGNIVRNNVAIDVDTGFRFGEYQDGAAGMQNTVVANNTFVRTKRCGIDLHSPRTNSGNMVVNNVVVPVRGSRAFCGGTRGTSMRNNLWAGNVSGVDLHASAITGSPRFVGGAAQAASSYRLASGSLGIDDGVTVGQVSDDIRGVRRPLGGRFDIGAFES